MTTTDAAAERLAALQARTKPESVGRIVTTAAAVAVTGALLTGMAVDRPAPAPAPPPTIVVVRRQAAAPAPAPAPAAVAPAPVASTGGS
jgi:hypothetical protein